MSQIENVSSSEKENSSIDKNAVGCSYIHGEFHYDYYIINLWNNCKLNA